METRHVEHVFIWKSEKKQTHKSGKLDPNASMDCTTQNVIYCLTCPTCGEHYIGQTNKLNARVRIHKQQIRDPSVRNTPGCKHFANCGGGNFKIFPFYKMWNENKIARQTKEDYFFLDFSTQSSTVNNSPLCKS